MSDTARVTIRICHSCGYRSADAVCPHDGGVMISEPKTLVGQTLNERYKIIGTLGSGGMGAVYKAQHLMLGTPCAVKVLTGGMDTADKERFARFQREGRVISTLNHPNIVRALDFGVHDEQPFLVMDFVEGQSLQELLKSDQRFAAPRAIRLFIQICDALAYAHSKGVIHRDLKPGNIMISRNEHGQEIVRLLDFGLAKMLRGEEGDEKLTKTGVVFGSPPYMSPEQCLGRSPDERSDIYSLGCVMYETLTGQMPITGGTTLEIIHNQISTMPRSFEDLGVTGIPPVLETVVLQTLAKDPDERQTSMHELKRQLEMALDPSAIKESKPQPQLKSGPTPKAATPPTPVPEPGPPSPQSAQPAKSKSAGTMIAVAIGAVGISALAAAVLMSHQPPTPPNTVPPAVNNDASATSNSNSWTKLLPGNETELESAEKALIKHFVRMCEKDDNAWKLAYNDFSEEWRSGQTYDDFVHNNKGKYSVRGAPDDAVMLGTMTEHVAQIVLNMSHFTNNNRAFEFELAKQGNDWKIVRGKLLQHCTTGIPTVVHDYTYTKIAKIGGRITDGDGKDIPNSGQSVMFANGANQVSYDDIPGLADSQAGDTVKLTLIRAASTSDGQPAAAGDQRGARYHALNLRTDKEWEADSSEHMSGGA